MYTSPCGFSHRKTHTLGARELMSVAHYVQRFQGGRDTRGRQRSDEFGTLRPAVSGRTRHTWAHRTKPPDGWAIEKAVLPSWPTMGLARLCAGSDGVLWGWVASLSDATRLVGHHLGGAAVGVPRKSDGFDTPPAFPGGTSTVSRLGKMAQVCSAAERTERLVVTPHTCQACVTSGTTAVTDPVPLAAPDGCT